MGKKKQPEYFDSGPKRKARLLAQSAAPPHRSRVARPKRRRGRLGLVRSR